LASQCGLGVKRQLLFVAKQQQQQQQRHIHLHPALVVRGSPSVLPGFHFVRVAASQPEATDLNSSRCHVGCQRYDW